LISRAAEGDGQENLRLAPVPLRVLRDARNAKLRKERGIGFEDVVFHIERGDLLDILEHPNPDR
jgi:hypothetical protein